MLDRIYRKLKPKKEHVFFSPIDLDYPNKESLVSVGGNTGNIVFTEAFQETIQYDKKDILSEKYTRKKEGRKNVIGIMPASNFLSPNAQWIVDRNKILELTDMQFTLVGLGAQAKLDETPRDIVEKLNKEQKYFFKLVSDRAVSIGVRGEFTAECLDLMGIHNVDIVGCPSFYKFENEFPTMPLCSSKKILYTKTYSQEVTEEFVKGKNSVLIAQCKESWGGVYRIFFDFQKWNEYIISQAFTFSFGTRFHGNMMALRNKVPTLWIVHDWRTLELVQYLGLPHLNLYDERLQNMKHIEELFEFCDYTEVYKRYPSAFKHYQEFLTKNMN